MKGFDLTDSFKARKGLFLVSDNDTVFFKVLDTFKGNYAHYQVVVKPERKLINNRIYSFECDGLTFERYGYKIYEKFPIKHLGKDTYYRITTWETIDKTNNSLPATPSLQFKKNKYIGKGTSCMKLASIFKLEHTNTVPTIYKLTLYRKGKKRSFFVLPNKRNGLLYIHYDMIGISEYQRYKVSLEAMDSRGNYSLPSKPKKYHTTYIKAILLSLSYAISF